MAFKFSEFFKKAKTMTTYVLGLCLIAKLNNNIICQDLLSGLITLKVLTRSGLFLSVGQSFYLSFKKGCEIMPYYVTVVEFVSKLSYPKMI